MLFVTEGWLRSIAPLLLLLLLLLLFYIIIIIIIIIIIPTINYYIKLLLSFDLNFLSIQLFLIIFKLNILL